MNPNPTVRLSTHQCSTSWNLSRFLQDSKTCPNFFLNVCMLLGSKKFEAMEMLGDRAQQVYTEDLFLDPWFLEFWSRPPLTGKRALCDLWSNRWASMWGSRQLLSRFTQKRLYSESYKLWRVHGFNFIKNLYSANNPKLFKQKYTFFL